MPVKKIDEKPWKQALLRLRSNPDFQVWRETVVAPYVLALQKGIMASDSLSEAELRAQIKTVKLLSYFFENAFDQVMEEWDVSAIEPEA